MPLLESFTVDHRTMKAPNVRKAKVMKGPKGDTVEVFDLRFMKPNTEYMQNSAIHTLEHLIATYMREKLEGIIDISPMGCRTGFYMSIFGEHPEDEIRDAFIHALKKVGETTSIPGAREEECGNFQDHSLAGAQEVAAKVIAGFNR